MKLVKLGVLALGLGFFAASCNNDSNTTDTTTKTDSATMNTAPPAAVTPVDTTAKMAPAAGMDTSNKMKVETKVETPNATKTTETKVDAKGKMDTKTTTNKK